MRLLPKRIADYATEIFHKGAEEITRASIRCVCGARVFQMIYQGKLVKEFLGPNLITCDDDGLLTLAAVCCKCRARIELFDSRTDGYSARIEETPRDRNWSREEKKYLCKKCGGQSFQVRVGLEYTGMEELDGFPNPEDYYSWIWIDAICSNCGAHIQGLIDVETA